jgi:hypothetical protein
MTVKLSDEGIEAAGTWSEVLGGIATTTSSLNGAPPPSGGDVSGFLRIESGYLVIDDGARSIYLRRF